MLQLKVLSSMAKVFLNEAPKESAPPARSVMANEILSFQVAYFSQAPLILQDCFLHLQTSHGDAVTVYEVRNVPCELPCYADADDGYLRREAGLFPDALILFKNEMRLTGGQWRSLWFEVNPEKLGIGEHIISITVWVDNGERQTLEVPVKVLDIELPPQKLIFTQWVHYDCIAQAHGVAVWSAEFTSLMWQYVENAVAHAMNMLMVPLVTPPLDTVYGEERLTVQLVDITVDNGQYSFDFTRLQEFLNTARALGIRYFEMTPLFTQWGAEHAPKIMATVNGEKKRIFGWETDSHSDEYSLFLKAFLTQLAHALCEWGVRDICYFHVSDEPQKPEHYIHYKKAYQLMSDCLQGFEIMDTLSSVEFYKEGYIKHPIAAADAYEKLKQAGAADMWAYYCCAQYKDVPNHFIALPSYRTRVLGAVLYRCDVWGFLHWGYNFWNGKYSERIINPYHTTDAGAVFPAGDPFVVYPGTQGPVSSIRQKLLREAINDNRALQLLEQYTDKQTVMALLQHYNIESFTQYPHSETAIQGLRNEINDIIANKI